MAVFLQKKRGQMLITVTKPDPHPLITIANDSSSFMPKPSTFFISCITFWNVLFSQMYLTFRNVKKGVKCHIFLLLYFYSLLWEVTRSTPFFKLRKQILFLYLEKILTLNMHTFQILETWHVKVIMCAHFQQRKKTLDWYRHLVLCSPTK